jgi:hypothetical protein
VTRDTLLVLALCAGCGASHPRDAGPADAGVVTDAARQGGGDAGSRDSGPIDSGGPSDAGWSDAGDGPYDCRMRVDCLRWWPNYQADCTLWGCCNGRLDRLGCICGDERGGCPAGDWWCCDDPLYPEIPVGCMDHPCE